MRSSRIQVEGSAFPLEDFFSLLSRHSLALVFSPDLCVGCRTQPFLEMRHRNILHSVVVWRIRSSSQLHTVETLSGGRYDFHSDPGEGWGHC